MLAASTWGPDGSRSNTSAAMRYAASRGEPMPERRTRMGAEGRRWRRSVVTGLSAVLT